MHRRSHLNVSFYIHYMYVYMYTCVQTYISRTAVCGIASYPPTAPRCRMAELSLVQHVQAADDALTRDEARSLLQLWYLTSPPSPAATAAPPRGVVLSHAVADGPEYSWADDDAFLGWADGPTGTARVAVELKVCWCFVCVGVLLISLNLLAPGCQSGGACGLITNTHK